MFNVSNNTVTKENATGGRTFVVNWIKNCNCYCADINRYIFALPVVRDVKIKVWLNGIHVRVNHSRLVVKQEEPFGSGKYISNSVIRTITCGNRGSSETGEIIVHFSSH
jgi:hypothetical protein